MALFITIIRLTEVCIDSYLILGFLLSHKIKILRKPIPKNVKWVNKEYYYVTRPSYENHIGHFAEAVNPLIFVLRFPSQYPIITDYLITHFNPNNEYEWDKTLLGLLISLFPENYIPRVHFCSDMKIVNITCFRHIVNS